MTAREYLSKLKKIELEIRQKTEERQELLERATSITASFGFDKVQTSLRCDIMANFVAKATDMEREIEESVVDLFMQKHTIINQIHELQNARNISVLFKRYVQYKCVEQVADELELSVQYIFEIQAKALREFEMVHADFLGSVIGKEWS